VSGKLVNDTPILERGQPEVYDVGEGNDSLLGDIIEPDVRREFQSHHLEKG
jgi:hypothetical protein